MEKQQAVLEGLRKYAVHFGVPAIVLIDIIYIMRSLLGAAKLEAVAALRR